MSDYAASPTSRRQFMRDTVNSYMQLMHWDGIGTDNSDDERFEKRFEEYIEISIKEDEGEGKIAMRPTIEGFCMACGISRQTYNSWKMGTIPVSERRRAAITKIDGFFLSLLTEWSLNGNINPATSIFYLKNNYGYADKVTHELKPEQSLLGKAKSNDEILAILKSDTGITGISDGKDGTDDKE